MASPNQELTPMQRQYRALKEKNKDSVLFFRLGDFYEMFNEDATLAARELDLTLTTRDRGKPKEEQTPMCGVPYHSVDAYIARMVQKGYKVAICEQMEDPATAKGLVERDITRIVTPGTVTESCMLDENKNNYMAYVYGDRGKFGLAFCDIYGTLKNIAIMAEELPRAFEYGLAFNAGMVRGFSSATHDDMVLHPDASTLEVLPWRPQTGRVARFYCDITYPDGTPFEQDGRQILRQALSAAQERGITARIAAKSEFYLFRLDENGDPVFFLQESMVAPQTEGILYFPFTLAELLDEI